MNFENQQDHWEQLRQAALEAVKEVCVHKPSPFREFPAKNSLEMIPGVLLEPGDVINIAAVSGVKVEDESELVPDQYFPHTYAVVVHEDKKYLVGIATRAANIAVRDLNNFDKSFEINDAADFPLRGVFMLPQHGLYTQSLLVQLGVFENLDDLRSLYLSTEVQLFKKGKKEQSKRDLNRNKRAGFRFWSERRPLPEAI